MLSNSLQGRHYHLFLPEAGLPSATFCKIVETTSLIRLGGGRSSELRGEFGEISVQERTSVFSPRSRS